MILVSKTTCELYDYSSNHVSISVPIIALQALDLLVYTYNNAYTYNDSLPLSNVYSI